MANFNPSMRPPRISKSEKNYTIYLGVPEHTWSSKRFSQSLKEHSRIYGTVHKIAQPSRGTE